MDCISENGLLKNVLNKFKNFHAFLTALMDTMNTTYIIQNKNKLSINHHNLHKLSATKKDDGQSEL